MCIGQKCKPCVDAKNAPTWTGLHTTPFYIAPYRALNGNLRKFAASSCPVQCLHQIREHIKKKLRMWRAQKCNQAQNTKPSRTAPYSAVNANLPKFPGIFRHDADDALMHGVLEHEAKKIGS